eukprot:361250-Chlamydomonas_euryale.AAC.5
MQDGVMGRAEARHHCTCNMISHNVCTPAGRRRQGPRRCRGRVAWVNRRAARWHEPRARPSVSQPWHRAAVRVRPEVRRVPAPGALCSGRVWRGQWPDMGGARRAGWQGRPAPKVAPPCT